MVSVFIAKVLGSYLIIISLFFAFRYRLFMSMLTEIVEKRSALFFIALLTLILGLLLVVSHNIWVADWRIVITILAWLTLLGGILRLFFPDMTIKMGKWWARNPTYLTVAMIIYFIIGIYLLYNAIV